MEATNQGFLVQQFLHVTCCCKMCYTENPYNYNGSHGVGLCLRRVFLLIEIVMLQGL